MFGVGELLDHALIALGEDRVLLLCFRERGLGLVELGLQRVDGGLEVFDDLGRP